MNPMMLTMRFMGKSSLNFFTACPAVISIEASVRVQNMTIAGTMVFLLPVTSFVFPSRSAADSPLKYAPRFLWRTSEEAVFHTGYAHYIFTTNSCQ